MDYAAVYSGTRRKLTLLTGMIMYRMESSGKSGAMEKPQPVNIVMGAD